MTNNNPTSVLKADDGTYWVSYAIQTLKGLNGVNLPPWGLLEHAIRSKQPVGLKRRENDKDGVWVPYTAEVEHTQGIQPDSQAFTLDEIELAKKMIAGE